MKIFLDGKWLTLDKAKMPINEPGLFYSQGIFETMRAENKNIFRLKEHLARLSRGAKLIKLNLGYSEKEIEGIIKKALSLNDYSPSVLRLTAWLAKEKTHLSLSLKKYRSYPKAKYQTGFKAIISSFFQNETSDLANIKTSARLHFLLAEIEAKKKNCDEAILLNTNGDIAEGARTNIFLAKDGVLYTPDASSGCLKGITRDTVLEVAKKLKIKTYERKIRPGELFSADEAFLTNSLIGLMPLTVLDNKKIANARAGPLTSIFIRKYHSLIQKG